MEKQIHQQRFVALSSPVSMQPVSGLLGAPPGPYFNRGNSGASNHKYKFCGKTDPSSSPVQ